MTVDCGEIQVGDWVLLRAKCSIGETAAWQRIGRIDRYIDESGSDTERYITVNEYHHERLIADHRSQDGPFKPGDIIVHRQWPSREDKHRTVESIGQSKMWFTTGTWGELGHYVLVKPVEVGEKVIDEAVSENQKNQFCDSKTPDIIVDPPSTEHDAVTELDVVTMKKYVIAVAGGTNLKGDIITAEACRIAAGKCETLSFCEMTENLIYESPCVNKEITAIPYPIAWMADLNEEKKPPFDLPVREMMANCLVESK